MEPVDVEKKVNVKTLAQWLEKVGHARESSNKSLTAIHVATREDEWECLQNMLEKGMDVNKTDDYGWTFKNVDLDPGETVETNKEGSDCYILAGNECEVTVNSPDTVGEEFKYHFNQYDCKKLTTMIY